jgi:molecular chaperone GrpE (heat shock protein)
VDDILADYDVQPFRCDGIQFNPRRQNAVKKLAAETPEQIKTVAESLSDGYERKGIVISKERVTAYAADANLKEA